MQAIRREIYRRLGAVLAASSALAAAGAARADDTAWSVELQAVYVEVTGHDPTVLAVRRDGVAGGVALDTDSTLGYALAARHDRGRWRYGLDFFIHRADQSAGPQEAAATGAGDTTAFEIPNRRFVSTAPDEVLYFRTLEDTTVELWVVDLFAGRRLGGEDGAWSFRFGVRNADFDNDYRAMAGIEGVGGSRIDASSNYTRMIGPMVGLAATFGRGRQTLELDLRQSIVFGDIELSRTLRDFEGPPGAFGGPPEEVPPGSNVERITATDGIEVPMTDARLRWRVRLGESWYLGADAAATAWWNLAVPPGTVPDRPDSREEATIVTYGLAGTVGFRF